MTKLNPVMASLKQTILSCLLLRPRRIPVRILKSFMKSLFLESQWACQQHFRRLEHSNSDGDSLNNLKSSDECLSGSGPLEQPYEPDQRSGSKRDSGITNMDDFDQSPSERKKSASPMVHSSQNCEYKTFTRVMLNRQRLVKHKGSINKRQLTIANSEALCNFSCENFSFSTKWEQAMDLHLSNHKIPGRKEDFFSKKRKRVFDSPLHNVYIVQFEFLATKQAETYLKICVLISHSTYICPSLFDCEELI